MLICEKREQCFFVQVILRTNKPKKDGNTIRATMRQLKITLATNGQRWQVYLL